MQKYYHGVKIGRVEMDHATLCVTLYNTDDEPIARLSVEDFHNGSYWSSRPTLRRGATQATNRAHTRTLAAIAARTPLDTEEGTIPHEGIRAGEIVGYRAWRCMYDDVLGARLFSLILDNYEWKAGVPAEGTLRPKEGIHAFKDVHFSNNYVNMMQYSIAHSIIVSGRVALWGDVIEHDLGYRAQYAMPLSFDAVHKSVYVLAVPRGLFGELRRKFLQQE